MSLSRMNESDPRAGETGVPPAGPRLNIIVARARNGVIGRDNQLPWHIPEELRYFKATTMGHVLLMGRRTFDSIGRPLPGRETIVLSRDPAWHHEGCHRAGDLDEALSIARGLAAHEVFVAGGATVYELALPRTQRLLITEVGLSPEGDVFFPEPRLTDWRETRREARRSERGIDFELTEWHRR